jgi:hypothetical protein
MSSISIEKALAIASETGIEIDEAADYYVEESEDGTEGLYCWGVDEPLVENHSGTSWL